MVKNCLTMKPTSSMLMVNIREMTRLATLCMIFIAKLLESGKMTEEEIIELYKLTAKQMQAIKERVTVMA